MKQEQLLQRSDDELLLEVGRALWTEDFGALPPSQGALRERATRWVAANSERVKQAICQDNRVQQLAENGFSIELVGAVLALLESLAIGTAASPLAVLLCKRGLQELCSTYWGDNEDGDTQ